MSDVTIAPNAQPSAPSPSQAPAQTSLPLHEVPVNAPASTSTPLGSQAPEKPAAPPQTAAEKGVERRAAIERAVKRAEAAQDPKAGERQRPGLGHNNPPEPTTKEAQPPAPATQPGDRQRGEGGRFAPREVPVGQPGQPGQPGRPQSRYTPLPDNAPYREPPRRFANDPQAAADWHGAPESVRGAVHRVTKEMEAGVQHYRAAAEEFQKVAHFHELARKHGTDLPTALSNYVGMEETLRNNMFGGLEKIVSNLFPPEPGKPRVTFADVAAAYLRLPPEQHQISHQQNNIQSQQIQMGQVMQTVQSLAQTVNQMQTEQVQGRMLSAVEQFAQSHPRLDELADVVKSEVDLGFSLEEAYARADRLVPSAAGNGGTHAAQTRTATAQTRSVDKSIHGAPDAGLSSRPRNGPVPSRRDALEHALKRVRASL